MGMVKIPHQKWPTSNDEAMEMSFMLVCNKFKVDWRNNDPSSLGKMDLKNGLKQQQPSFNLYQI